MTYNYSLLKLDRDFHPFPPLLFPVGTICEFLSIEYLKDEMLYAVVFKEIGKPVDHSPSTNVEFK